MYISSKFLYFTKFFFETSPCPRQGYFVGSPRGCAPRLAWQTFRGRLATPADHRPRARRTNGKGSGCGLLGLFSGGSGRGPRACCPLWSAFLGVVCVLFFFLALFCLFFSGLGSWLFPLPPLGLPLGSLAALFCPFLGGSCPFSLLNACSVP